MSKTLSSKFKFTSFVLLIPKIDYTAEIVFDFEKFRKLIHQKVSYDASTKKKENHKEKYEHYFLNISLSFLAIRCSGAQFRFIISVFDAYS